MRTHTVVLTLALAAAAAGCGGHAPAKSAPQPPPSTAAVARAGAGPSASERRQFLDRFARGYYPGRSGQVFVVPRQGAIITTRDPLYKFMHGSPWEYDTRIPFILSGAPFIKAHISHDEVVQQDMAPTIGALIGLPPLATMTGRVLSDAINASAGRPSVVVLFMLDAARADYFTRYADRMPTLSRLAREGASYDHAQVNSMPTVTSVGHATVGTGTDPRMHGLVVNNLFNRVTGKPQEAYDKLDPRELMVMTLADAWNIATDGKAVIIGQGGAIRAVAGLVGHGACLINGRPVIAASYNAADAGWETNRECYRMPDYLSAINGKPMWEAAGGTWMGHDIASPTKFRASSLFQKMEGDALAAIIAHEPLGADDVTDLVMVNMKGPDYTGHAYGPDSPEIQATLAELDAQIARVIAALEQKAGKNKVVIAVTADHGMPPEPPAGQRFYNDEIAATLSARFDPEKKAIITYYGDPANSEIYLDTGRLAALKVSLRDVAAFLETQPAFLYAFTEDEVAAAAAHR